MSKYDAIRAAERELLTSSTRRDGARLRELLHPDFVEIGRSSRRWNRDEIVESLATEDERLTPTAQHWDFVDFSSCLVLVTYRIRSGDVESTHASVWDTSTEPLRIRFHQGTVISKR